MRTVSVRPDVRPEVRPEVRARGQGQRLNPDWLIFSAFEGFMSSTFAVKLFRFLQQEKLQEVRLFGSVCVAVTK